MAIETNIILAQCHGHYVHDRGLFLYEVDCCDYL